ncbi:MAG: glycosyltransferase family 2 protein [Pseudomonadota bacterium]
MPQAGPPLSLVIPCYNEAEHLPALVARCLLLAGATGGEVILVDNGSTDGTPALLARLLEPGGAVRSVRVKVNRGYGHGILEGLRAARGEFVGWTHGDLQTDPLDVIRAMDVVTASPTPELVYVKGLRAARPLADTLFTVGMSGVQSLLTGRLLRDVNAQPNLMHRSIVDAWRNPPTDSSFDLFALAEAKRRRLKVARIPVLCPERLDGEARAKLDWRATRDVIQRTLGDSLRLRRTMARTGA